MGRILTNNISLAYSIEDTFSVLNTSGEWKSLEPNDITTFGATITTVPRSPISRTRQRRKGTTTDLDSAVEFEHDLTMEVFVDFIEGFVFATFYGEEYGVPTDAATSNDTFTVASGDTPATGTLVYATGFTNSANNGLHEVTGTPSATAIPVTTNLTDESSIPASQNARIEIAGRRGTASDLDLDVTSGVGTLTSAAAEDFTTWGLEVGQVVHIGGLLAANQFDNAGGGFAGYMRLTSITATTLVGDKLSSSLVTDDGSGDTVDILFGRFLKNVPTTQTTPAAEDGIFIERSFQFEVAMPNLGSGGATRWEYSLGNLCNTMAISMPLADKAVVTFGFVGTDTNVPTSTQATNADTPVNVVRDTAFNTTSDVLRLRVLSNATDTTGITTCFKDATLTLNNSVTPEKCIGTLGAEFMNTGNFEVDLESQILFTDEAVAAAIRNNTTVTLDLLLRNDNGAIFIDLPALTLGDGGKEFPVNESVLMNLTGSSFGDPTLDTSIGVSLFPVIPTS